MDIDNRTLRGRRNAPFSEVLTYTDDVGEPFDFSGATATMQVRQYGAQAGAALIDLAETSLELTEGVLVGEGILSIYIDEVSLKLLPTAAPGADVTFVYDLKVTLSGSPAEIWAQGPFIVSPGVTDRLGIRVTTETDIRITVDGSVRVTE